MKHLLFLLKWHLHFSPEIWDFCYREMTLLKVTLLYGKVALIKFIAILMMSAKLFTSDPLKRTTFPEKRLWHQLLTVQSNYILCVKYVPFCHTTEVFIQTNIFWIKYIAILICWYITLTHFCSMPLKNSTVKWCSIKTQQKQQLCYARYAL